MVLRLVTLALLFAAALPARQAPSLKTISGSLMDANCARLSDAQRPRGDACYQHGVPLVLNPQLRGAQFLNIANQEAVAAYVGDWVQIQGTEVDNVITALKVVGRYSGTVLDVRCGATAIPDCGRKGERVALITGFKVNHVVNPDFLARYAGLSISALGVRQGESIRLTELLHSTAMSSIWPAPWTPPARKYREYEVVNPDNLDGNTSPVEVPVSGPPTSDDHGVVWEPAYIATRTQPAPSAPAAVNAAGGQLQLHGTWLGNVAALQPKYPISMQMTFNGASGTFDEVTSQCHGTLTLSLGSVESGPSFILKAHTTHGACGDADLQMQIRGQNLAWVGHGVLHLAKP